MLQNSYVLLATKLDQLHWFILESLKEELERLSVHDLTPQQALIIYHLGPQKITIHDVIKKGYYSGSNVSYNIKKLVNAEYLIYERSTKDRRSIRVFLAPKGLDFWMACNNFILSESQNIQNMPLSHQEWKILYEQLQRLHFFFFETSRKKHSFNEKGSGNP
jgi:DNA-binding MarR family transcriptional regulator